MFLANVCKDAKTTTLHNDGAADGSATTITLVATAGQVWVVDTIFFSYSAAPAAGATLAVTINGVTVFKHAVTAGGLGFAPARSANDEGFYGNKNEAVVVTLSAGGGVIQGRLTVKYR